MTQTTYFPFVGGLDQASPPYSIQPGSVIEAENFDIGPLGGYSRINGFERFDGRPEPHLAAPLDGAETALEFAQARADAADVRRALITPVPGSGPVRGVVVYDGTTYAFRNNAGGTACVMHKSSAAGWVVVTTPALLPGGSYRFALWNFGGAANSQVLYGCDGVNKAFSFDGTTYTEITTGMSPDTPQRIAAHQNHLFLTFGASLQHSAIANPASWTPVLGAGEFAMGDIITNIMPAPGGSQAAALFVTTTTSMRVLYGNDAADWQLITLSFDTGAYANSLVTLGFGFCLGRRGVIAINPSDTFSNFNVSSLSQKIEKYLAIYGAQLAGTSVSFSRNQMVFHFTNGQALTATMTREGPTGFMPLNYGRSFTCFWSCACPADKDLILAGGADGYVYRMGVGTSFDGEAIPSRLWLSYAHFGSPRNRKRYRKAVIEATADGYAMFSLTASYSYADPDVGDFVQTDSPVRRQLAVFDTDTWDAFFFDGRPLDPVQIKLEGSGESVALIFASNTALADRFTLHGSIVHFDPRRLVR